MAETDDFDTDDTATTATLPEDSAPTTPEGLFVVANEARHVGRALDHREVEGGGYPPER